MMRRIMPRLTGRLLSAVRAQWVSAAKKRALVAAVPVLLAAAPAAASEQAVYQSLSPQDVMEILLLNGLTADTQSINGGEVVANQRVVVEDRIAWIVYLYNCGEDGRCSDIQFRAAFSGARPTLEAMNDWNSSHRFTRAYRTDDGEAVLEMDVNAQGGVTVGHVSSLIPLWRAALGRYYLQLAGRRQASDVQ